MTRSELEEIIMEEISAILNEIDEIAEIAVKRGKPRAGAGKEFKGKPNPIGPNKTQYTSAGTVNSVRNRKLGPKGSAKYEERKKVGQKILNALRRGGSAGRALEARIKKQMEKHGGPIKGSRGFVNKKWTKKDLMYSYVWALASDFVAKGGTAATFKITKKPSKDSTGEE